MKKFIRILTLIILGASVLIVFVYCAMWFLVAHNMQAHIDSFWAKREMNSDFVIIGDKPKVTGFPMPPEVIFSGVITIEQGIAFNIPEIQMIGFPLSGLTLYFEMPQGMDVSTISGEMKGFHVDFAAANITLPSHPPLQGSYNEMKKWQAIDDPLLVNGFDLHAGAVRIQGRGLLGIDEELQPDLRLESRIDGMDALFERLSENANVNKKGLDMAKGFLQMVSKVDPNTNSPYFETGFYIQHRGVFVGPMRIYNFPEIIWDGTPREKTLSRRNLH